MTLAELRASRAAKVAALKKLTTDATGRDFTTDEQASYDQLKGEVESLNKQIGREEEVAGYVQHGAQSAGAASRGGDLPLAPAAKKEFEDFGEFIHTVRFNPDDQRLNYVEFNGDQRSEQRMDTGSGGGFAVPTQFRDQLLSVKPEDAIVRSRATVIPAGSPPDSAVTIPALDQSNGSTGAKMYAGVEVGWIEEGETKPDTDFKLREITLSPKEVAGVITVTDKLLRNWGAASALIEAQLRAAILAAEDNAFISGNGVGKPLGFLSDKNTSALNVNRANANTVGYADIVDMFSKLQGSDGIWVVTKGALAKLMRMEDTEGHLIWQPNAAAGPNGTLLGMPILVNNRSPLLGAKGDISLVDLKAYLIKDGSGIFVAASEHALFKQNKTLIKAFWNVDGQPWLTAPIVNENGFQTSPFVILDVPA